ncbi:MAG: DNA-binding domain-containing protein [Acidiferrobacterales bacterium]|nr:DNA-binding domain-containing protein [Acidiferrobacterales bacterium]
MSALRNLQLAFAWELYGPTSLDVASRIRANGLSGERRLQVYRNNMSTSLTEALRAIYPVVQRLVGEEFFRHAARHYIRRHPSRSGNLHDSGDKFPLFLAAFPAARELCYLADIARLEWAYHEVFHAAGAQPLDLTRLATIPPEHHEKLRFHLHPASRLVRSPYPILRIWEVNQEDYDGKQHVDLDDGGANVLVIRRGLDIALESYGDGEFALLEAFQRKQRFADACRQALTLDPNIDLSTFFQQLMFNGTLVEVSQS